MEENLNQLHFRQGPNIQNLQRIFQKFIQKLNAKQKKLSINKWTNEENRHLVIKET